MKSSCFFCPASKPWDLFWLAANEPALWDRALYLERNALTGRHSRFDAVEFGATWEDLVRNADSFPSSETTVGLGRRFAWNHWAQVNGVVDAEFRIIRAECRRSAQLADAMRGMDNALDGRTELASRCLMFLNQGSDGFPLHLAAGAAGNRQPIQTGSRARSALRARRPHLWLGKVALRAFITNPCGAMPRWGRSLAHLRSSP